MQQGRSHVQIVRLTASVGTVVVTVGMPVAVANAVPEVKAMCSVQLTRSGGAGAIREFAEVLLKARGEWVAMTERYVAERSVAAVESAR